MVEITVRNDGPYHITGAFEIEDHEGNTVNEEREIWLPPRCGQSAKKLLCDGIDKRIAFRGDP